MPSAKDDVDAAVARAVSDTAESERRAFARGKQAGESRVYQQIVELQAKLAKAAGNTRPAPANEQVAALLAAIDAAIAHALAHEHGVGITREYWQPVIDSREAMKGKQL